MKLKHIADGFKSIADGYKYMTLFGSKPSERPHNRQEDEKGTSTLEEDWEALRGDFRAVGRDMWKAIGNVSKELENSEELTEEQRQKIKDLRRRYLDK